jgi:hypothetical protein
MHRLLERNLDYGRAMTVRVEGHAYSKGDFMLRIGSATQVVQTNQVGRS